MASYIHGLVYMAWYTGTRVHWSMYTVPRTRCHCPTPIKLTFSHFMPVGPVEHVLGYTSDMTERQCCRSVINIRFSENGCVLTPVESLPLNI